MNTQLQKSLQLLKESLIDRPLKTLVSIPSSSSLRIRPIKTEPGEHHTTLQNETLSSLRAQGLIGRNHE